MKILITGANGFIGAHFIQYCLDYHLNFVATGTKSECCIQNAGITYAMMDVTNPNQVWKVLQHYQPNVIVHAAAMSKPDECQSNEDTCLQINLMGTQHLLTAASKLNHDVHFIFISTDFVFGGNGPNAEDALKQPLNFYGISKLMAELCVMQLANPFAIVRPSFVFGPEINGVRKDFLHGVLHKIQRGETVSIVNDQYRTPTFVPDFCKGLHQIITQQATGIFHLAGSAYITPYQMVMLMVQLLQLPSKQIHPVTANDFPEPVKRAKKGGLVIEKAQNILGYTTTDIETAIRLSFAKTD
ncbi:SDR family oxidoreductase [Hydrotalea sp.]|uniref:SDR family oxidoreductase n=1 Tax=Hydrotalea sp. TaxID=2881279 RepID=UPI002626A0C5|nr:SDR family oxidoreductase [Hydrotalea sp.]